MGNVPEKLLTIEDVATRLDCTARTVQSLMANGKIKFARLGRAVRFRKTWVDDFLDGRDMQNPATDNNPAFS